MKQRDLNIDFMKIVCAFFVVFIHTMSYFQTDVSYFFMHICRCSVPVFFMVSGYFYKKPKSKKDVCKFIFKYLKLLLVSFVLCMFLSCILGMTPIHSAISVSLKKFIGLVTYGYLAEDTFLYGHLWFLVAMLEVAIISPIFGVFMSDEEDLNKKRRYWMTVLFLLNFIVPTFKNFFNLKFLTLSYLSPAYLGSYYLLYIFIGFELKLFFEKQTSKKSVLTNRGLILFVFSILAYFAMSKTSQLADAEFGIAPYFRFNDVFIKLASIGFFLVFKSLNMENLSEQYKDAIFKLSEYNLTVYLVHMPLMYVLHVFDLSNTIFSITGSSTFNFAYAFVVYIVSLGVAIIIKAVNHLKSQRKVSKCDN